MIAGYGMQCPFLKTTDVIELSSLQIFEYGLFGFHIGITLYGSKSAKEVIIKYASSIEVIVQKKSIKKRKTQEVPLFSVKNGSYVFDKQVLILRGAYIQGNKGLVINMLDSLISILDDVENNIVINIEMSTDQGAKKMERFHLNLTHCHRAIMVYELSVAKKEFMDS
jgi:hypothetical protein